MAHHNPDTPRDLRDLLHDHTPQPPSSVTFDRVAQRVRRTRTRRLAVGALAGVVAVAGVGWWQRGGDPEAARDLAPAQTTEPSDTSHPSPGVSWEQAKISRCAGLRNEDENPFTATVSGVRYRAVEGYGELFALPDLGVLVETGRCGGQDPGPDSTSSLFELYAYTFAGFDPGCAIGVRRDTSDGLVGDVVVLEAVKPDPALDCELQSEMPGTGGFRSRVHTHCGVRSLRLNRQLWIADPQLVDNGNPPPGWGANYATGLFVIDGSGQRAEFRGDSGVTAQFRIARTGEQDPAEPCD